MQTFKQYKGILLLLVVVIIGVLLYFFVFKKDEPLTTTESSSTAQILGQDLLGELNRLKSLSTINSSLFASPSFANLNDITVFVVPKPVGKQNPFTP